MLREVCGSYDGAVTYRLWTNEPTDHLAARLAEHAGCEYYTVDGTVYGPFHGPQHKETIMTTRMTLTTIHDAGMSPSEMADVARQLYHAAGPFDLCDESGDVIRDATERETVDSILSGREGWIEVGGQRCYVAD